MYCDEALDAVEAVAVGDLTPDGRLADHYATCPNCSAALGSARALDQMLQRRPAPRPGPQFTSRTLARVRRARWHSDQVLDVGFNLAIGGVVLAVIVGVWLLLKRTGLVVVSNDAFEVMTQGAVTLAHSVSPSLPLYAAAMALLATALGVWWWAERDAAL